MGYLWVVIMLGVLCFGMFICFDEMVVEFGVSVMLVWEVLLKLCGEGMVGLELYCGYVVLLLIC